MLIYICIFISGKIINVGIAGIWALTSNDIRVGTNIEVDGAPWRVLGIDFFLYYYFVLFIFANQARLHCLVKIVFVLWRVSSCETWKGGSFCEDQDSQLRYWKHCWEDFSSGKFGNFFLATNLRLDNIISAVELNLFFIQVCN